MALTFRQLKYFLVLSEELHFGRAARRLHISQPPLSTSLRQLEEELQVTLLERNSKRVALTAAGEAFRREARRLLEHLDDSRSLVKRIASSTSGRIRVGFTPSMIFRHLPEKLAALQDSHPGIEVQLIERNSADQIQALAARQIDMGLIHSMPLPPEFSAITIAEDAFLACLPPHHPLAARRFLSIRDLAREPLIMFSRNLAPHYYDRIVSLFRIIDLEPAIKHEVAHWLTVVALVAHNMGVSLVPQALAGPVFKDVVFVPLRDVTVQHQSQCIWVTGDRHPQRDLLIQLLRDQ